MKLVWKCDHCSHTDVDRDEVGSHEKSCIFNPSNRHCYTCDNHYTEYDSDYCKVYNGYKGLKPFPTNNFEKFYEVFDDHKKCDSWSNHEVKMKKLKKIKKKIDESS